MANQDFSRTRRIADQIGREVATLLLEEIEDRRVRGVTVSGVDVSADKRVATVYVSLPLHAAVDDTMKALKRASSLLRRRLAKRIRIKFLPELRFVYDPSLDQVDRIEQLLRGLPPAENAEDTGTADTNTGDTNTGEHSTDGDDTDSKVDSQLARKADSSC